MTILLPLHTIYALIVIFLTGKLQSSYLVQSYIALHRMNFKICFKEHIMKLTEELLKEMEEKKELYADGIIMPDGDYRLITDGHLKTLMALLPYTEHEIWKMIPEDDSALFWLVEKTGCVLTDVNSTIGMEMTPAQEKTYKALSGRGIVSSEYYDLTRQREKFREQH